MNSILVTSLSFLLLYKYVAFVVIVFLGAFLLPLPDNLILLATGAFASQGYFNLYIVIAVAIATAITSDMAGYFLTRTFGMKMFNFFHIKESHIKTIHRYVNDYTAVTIFVTRIAGPFGPAVNFIAGLIEVSWQEFLLYDSLGNIVDIVVYMVAGYLLGNYWLVYSDQIGWIVAILGLVMLVASVIYKSVKNKKQDRKSVV